MKWIDTTKKSHRFMVVITIFTAVIGLWRCLSQVPRLPAEYRVFYYNHTDSLPRGLYLRMPLRELQDGDYVVFEPTEAITSVAYERGWLSPGVRFLKQVGAVAGECYEIESDSLQFKANGRYIGQVYPQDWEGRPMPEIRGSFLVPEGEFLPIGTNPRSFDGRYTGTVPLKNITARVIPLLTGTWMP